MPNKNSTPALIAPQLADGLEIAESIRKKIVLNYSVIGFVLFAGLIIEAVTWMSIAVVIIILFVLVYTKWYGIPVSLFEKKFIERITNNTIQLIDPGLKVDFQSHLKLSEINTFGLMPDNPDYFSGKNLIYGTIGEVPLQISEIYAEWKEDNRKIPAKSGIFNALEVIASNHLTDEGIIYLSTHIEHLENKKLNLSDTTIKNNDSGIYYLSTNKNIEISNRLNTFFNYIQQYHLASGKQVIYALKPNFIELAILNEKSFNYFEPSVFKTVYNNKAANTYYSDLSFLCKAVSL